jgi:hypothetical protein
LKAEIESLFLKATLDLYTANFIPKFFVEFIGSWHDNPKQIDNDRMKKCIAKAGMVLHRLRKRK